MFNRIKCPETAEAIAARCNVLFVHELHFRNVIFEGDCISVIRQLQVVEVSLGHAGGIIHETKGLVECFDSVMFHFVRRTANTVTPSSGQRY